MPEQPVIGCLWSQWCEIGPWRACHITCSKTTDCKSQPENPFMMCIFFVCDSRIRLKIIHLALALEPPVVLTLFFRGNDCFTGARWFLHATQSKTLWSPFLSLVSKMSAIITKLDQLKCCNHGACCFSATTHSKLIA